MNGVSLPVVTLTITVSLCLVFTLVVFFLRHQSRRFDRAESDSLLPLAEETPRIAGTAARHETDHDHDHNDDGCGCRSGRKVPCPGCLKRPPIRS